MADTIYESIYSGYQIIVQGAEPIFAPGTGVQIGRTKELTAEFGTFGPEVDRLDSEGEIVKDSYTGAPLKTAVIHGNVFDLQQQASDKGWTEDETELVRLKVEWQCEQTPSVVWRRTRAKLSAPWPTYDETHHKQIPTLAQQLGLVGEALAYEVENKNRAEITEKLREALRQPVEEEALIAE